MALFGFFKHSPLQAVTYFFSGTTSQGIGSLATGTTYTGTFSYNYPQPLNIFQGPAMPPRGLYENAAPTMTFIVGSDISISTSSSAITIENTALNPPFPYVDSFSVSFWFSGLMLGGKQINGIDLLLQDATGTAFTDLNLPGDALRLNQFNYTSKLRINYRGDWNPQTNMYDYATADAPLTSLVPEPSSLLLMLAGGAVLMAGRQKS